MKYKLNCIEPESGVKIPLFFDSNTHVLSLEDGRQFQNEYWRMNRKLAPGKKVRLLMGTNCNMNCSYCSQEKTDIPYKFDDCRNVLEILGAIPGDISVIEFWGGEPLAYIKHIELMVSLIRGDPRYDKTQFAIITNGKLLTDKIVDFLIRQRFRVQISYDGSGQRFRTGSEFDYFKLKVKQIKRLLNDPYMKANRCINFAAVLIARQDLFTLQKYFESLFGQKVNIQPIPLLFMRADLLAHRFSEDEHRKVFDQTFELSIKDEHFYSCQNQTNELACSILHQNTGEASRPCVTADDKDIVVDIKGNLFLCQNRQKAKDIIGNVLRGDSVYKKRDMFRHYEVCDSCLLQWSCHGACRILDGELFVETCRSYFYYYFAMFCAAVYKITGLYVISVEDMTLPIWRDGRVQAAHYDEFSAVDVDAIKN